MFDTVKDQLAEELAAVRDAGMEKHEAILETRQGARITLQDGSELINLCANNYLGLAGDPAMADAAHAALDQWGFGLASVRFICGTQEIHRRLEERIAAFLGTEDAILFGSCFDANTGLFEVLLTTDDAVISDELNHASIIDGIRLTKAQRLRYRNSDMADLEGKLQEASGARRRMIATDGVFSMDGYIANLPAICDLAERYDAMVMVDDSHAVGILGPGGRGTPESTGAGSRVDILTGTLGKAIGGASGGYVASRREVVELLRQRSRPYLFSNTVAPPIVGAALAALDLLESSGERRERLAAEHGMVPGAARPGRPGGAARRAPDRAGDAGRREPGGALLGGAAERGSARRGLHLPGGAARPGADPHPDLGRPLGRRPGAGGRRVRGGSRAAGRGCFRCLTPAGSRARSPSSPAAHTASGWPRRDGWPARAHAWS